MFDDGYYRNTAVEGMLAVILGTIALPFLLWMGGLAYLLRACLNGLATVASPFTSVISSLNRTIDEKVAKGPTVASVGTFYAMALMFISAFYLPSFNISFENVNLFEGWANAQLAVETRPVQEASALAFTDEAQSVEIAAQPLVAEANLDTTAAITNTHNHYATITAESIVRVRAGEGITFTVVSTVEPGVQVTVLGENADASWINILMDDGTEGWVAAFLLDS